MNYKKLITRNKDNYLCLKGIIFSLIILLLFAVNYGNIALAENSINGEKIFNIHCVGCHPQGNNIIRRGKTLKEKALKKYKMDSIEAISYLVTNGKNNMSAFQDRLTKEEIETVAKYVLEKAASNWR